MKKVCVITGSRAEYGIMKPLMRKLNKEVDLDVVVTAMHLEGKYGSTYKVIEKDGFNIVKKIPLNLVDTKKKTIAKSLAILNEGLVDLFEENTYDLIIILGDRYEMLPVANTALIYQIPICHIHGGEKTLGNYDEMIRHSISKMSHLHLVSAEEFRNRLLQLGEEENRVFNIGAMGVENVLNQEFLTKKDLEEKLDVKLDEYYVVLFHPVTLEKGQDKKQIEELLSALSEEGKQYIFIASNSDTGSDDIMNKIEKFVEKNPTSKIFTSLTTQIYHSLVKHSLALVGNSSSGLIEVPSLKVPTLNIGNRQLGRLRGASVVDVEPNKESIVEGFAKTREIKDFTNPYEKENSSSEGVRHILEFLKEENVLVKDFNDGNISGKGANNHLKEIEISDLLGRKEIVLNQSQLSTFFEDKTVLVTGAGGSIGSEICRQIIKFKPKSLILLGHGENSIYLIHRELLNTHGDSVKILPVIADIQDRDLMFDIMKKYQIDIVYHAAAHKHVPLMEYNPREAVKNNILGTKNVADAAKAAKIEKFVMVSTDKAVNPTNVMGATKRVAEMIVTALNDSEETQFVAVRFGNVLGSRGSVVPVFKEQIENGGPLTVTDFRMTRYFMTIPEASRLVIQAGHLAKGGEVFVLDMGEPVKIVDLAKKIIRLSGCTVPEIGIKESGIRPGEKLYEELLSSEERVSEQIHEKIFVGKVISKPLNEVTDFIEKLAELNNQELRDQLIDFAKQEE